LQMLVPLVAAANIFAVKASTLLTQPTCVVLVYLFVHATSACS